LASNEDWESNISPEYNIYTIYVILAIFGEGNVSSYRPAPTRITFATLGKLSPGLSPEELMNI
jgi:hypothetical protein